MSHKRYEIQTYFQWNIIGIGIYTRPTEGCHSEWPRLTLSVSVTRSVARYLGDSFLYCLARWDRNRAMMYFYSACGYIFWCGVDLGSFGTKISRYDLRGNCWSGRKVSQRCQQFGVILLTSISCKPTKQELSYRKQIAHITSRASVVIPWPWNLG